MTCVLFFAVSLVDAKRPVDDISERSSETTEHDRSELSLSESFDMTSEDEVKIEEGLKDLREKRPDEKSEDEMNEEVTEVIEKVHIKRIRSDEYKAEAQKDQPEERRRGLAELTAMIKSRLVEDDEVPVVQAAAHEGSTDEEAEEMKHVMEEAVEKQMAPEREVTVDLGKLENLKEDSKETVETVTIETLEKLPVEVKKEAAMEIVNFAKKPESLSESDTDEDDDPNKVVEVQEEEYMEGDLIITKKTVRHSSHSATVTKGTPKVTETYTVIREVKGPETLESTSKGKTVQQFTTTVSGTEAEEKIAKMNRLRVEGQAKEVTLPEIGGKVKESNVKMLNGREPDAPEKEPAEKTVQAAVSTETKKVGPDTSDEDVRRSEEEEVTTLVRVDEVGSSKPDAGGDAKRDEEEDGVEFSIRPELIPWMQEAPTESGDSGGIMYETDKTIKTEEMQLLDEITVETKILEVKTIKMELSSKGDVSVLETTEVRTDTDMKESRQSKEREETVFLHTKADQKPVKVAGERMALPERPASAGSLKSGSESEPEGRSPRRERTPVPQRTSKPSDSLLPDQSPIIRPEVAEAVSRVKGSNKELSQDESTQEGYDDGPYICVAVSAYDPESDEVLSLHEGEQVEVIDDTQDDWWLVRKLQASGREGWVPGQYLRDKAVYDRVMERQLARAIEQLPSATSKRCGKKLYSAEFERTWEYCMPAPLLWCVVKF